MNNKQNTRLSHFVERLKDSPVFMPIIFVGILIISVGSFLDASLKIHKAFTQFNKSNELQTVTISTGNLITDTESLYKKAAYLMEDGIAVSPKTSEERAKISDPSKHPAHFKSFESKYNELIVDSEILILRAMFADEILNATDWKISEQIENIFPSPCQELQTEYGKVGLRTQNYIDLKCLLIVWRSQHTDRDLTEGTNILKKVNWEGRKRTLFSAISAITATQRFKYSVKEN